MSSKFITILREIRKFLLRKNPLAGILFVFQILPFWLR